MKPQGRIPTRKTRTVHKVLVTALASQNEEAANADVGEDRECREVPHEGVPNEVDLTVILDPAEERIVSAATYPARDGREELTS